MPIKSIFKVLVFVLSKPKKKHEEKTSQILFRGINSTAQLTLRALPLLQEKRREEDNLVVSGTRNVIMLVFGK